MTRQDMRHVVVMLAVLCGMVLLGAPQAAIAQGPSGASTAAESAVAAPLDVHNPFSILRHAGHALDQQLDRGQLGGPARTDGSIEPGDDLPDHAMARGQGQPIAPSGGLTSTLSILLLLTILTIAPAILILCTSFTRIIIVLALLRQAIGTQSLPPSQVIIGLSVFLTLLVMAPTFEQINKQAIIPLTNEEIDEMQAWELAKQPLRRFMFDQIDYAQNWDDVYLILNYRGIDTSDPSQLTEDDVDMITLVPAFVLSELKIAFLMGFRLYLPFLIIDMVISSVLISMGMLMLPPVLISLPFKLLLFVLVDGWRLVAGNLLASFAVPGVTT